MKAKKRYPTYIDRSGEIWGDYKLLERVTDKSSSYKVVCTKCGAEKIVTTQSLLKRPKCKCSKVYKCRTCGKELPQGVKRYYCSDECRNKNFHKCVTKKRDKKRKITNTTRMLICVYTAEGMSTKEIADILFRDEKTVEQILTICKKNGKYTLYTDNSPVLEAKRKRRCT